MKIEKIKNILFRNAKSLLKDVSDYALANASDQEYAALILIGVGLTFVGIVAIIIFGP